MEKKDITHELPDLTSPLDDDQIVQLLTHLRYKTKADKYCGYNLCRHVNRQAVIDIKRQLPETSAYSLICRNYTGIRRVGQVGVEHFVGVAEGEDCFYWFEGTGDQLKVDIGNIVVRKVKNEQDVISDVEQVLGGKWEVSHIGLEEIAEG